MSATKAKAKKAAPKKTVAKKKKETKKRLASVKRRMRILDNLLKTPRYSQAATFKIEKSLNE